MFNYGQYLDSRKKVVLLWLLSTTEVSQKHLERLIFLLTVG